MSDLNLFITAVQREQTRLQAMNAEANRQLRDFSRTADDNAMLDQLPGLMDVLIKTEVTLGFRNMQVAKLQTELGVLAHGPDAFTRNMMRAMHPFPPPFARTSTAKTTHWQPNAPATSAINSGRSTAAVFRLTLSAPARKSSLAFSTDLTPPPTVRGKKTSSAVFLTASSKVPRASAEAVMSKKTNSSAPCSL